MARSLACTDEECDFCRSEICDHWCHGGEDDDLYDDFAYGGDE